MVCEKERVSFALLLDILAPVVLPHVNSGRWGNFTNQEAHGGSCNAQVFLEGLHFYQLLLLKANAY